MIRLKSFIQRIRNAKYITSLTLVVLVSLSCFLATDYIGYKIVALLLLMMVSLLAMFFDTKPVIIAAFLSALIWNFFFIPPLFTFHITHADDTLMFLLYFVIATVNAVLTTKIREAERKARDREQKDRTIKLYNTLFNSLSHELKTPISSIMVAVDTLKGGNFSKQITGELLSEIEFAGLRLNRQVEHLLNMSRLENAMLKLHSDWCDANELVFSVIQKFESYKSHLLLFDPREDFPLIKIDIGLIENVLHNLIHNAIQYTPDHSVIRITISMDDQTFVMEVSDDGPGFPEEDLKQVFQKFYRVPNTRTGGTGLGLSIAKGFVEAHSGTISVTNQQPHGACFTIRIPVETSYVNNLMNE
jgi:two-component system sensor histidine kinase KdpD